MSSRIAPLLATRRFLPLFLTQALGAWNDNFFKNALVILVTYRLADGAGVDAPIFITAAAGLFILPFFLFSATAGRLADRYDRARLIQVIKALEIPIMALGAVGLLRGDVALLMIALFLMGTQSTFFGPLKYAILPDHLREDELLGGNALVDAGTFLAILLGTIAGGIVIANTYGAAYAAVGALGAAVLGFATSWFIPRAPAAAPDLKLSWNLVRDTAETLRYPRRHRVLCLSILGISWFWLVGATFLSQFPTYVRIVLNADEHVVTLFLAVFSIGVGLGSLLSHRLLRGEISARHVPLAALGISVFAIDLYVASAAAVPAAAPGSVLIGLEAYLGAPASWRVLADLLGIAVCGGLFIVPLYTLLQERSAPEHRARVIAANNIVNAFAMVVAALATVAMLALGFTVVDVFLAVGVANLAVAVHICRLLPDELLKTALASLLHLLYRVEVRGLEHYRALTGPAVIVCNHVSFLDGVLLAAFLPDRPLFAIDTFVAQRWWAKPAFWVADVLTVDPTNPYALRDIVRAVSAGRRCVIFPEGRITVTGALMKIYEGPGLIADRARAPIVPIRIDGAQYTAFSRLAGKVRRRWFPRITLTVLPAHDLRVPEAVIGRARRRAVGQALLAEMTQLVFATSDWRRTLFEALLDARTTHGRRHVILNDIERRPMTLQRLVAASFALSGRLRRLGQPGGRVGVLLPTSRAAAATFFALQACGRVPAILNFSTGAKGMLAAVAAAELATVITSRRFVAQAKLGDAVAALEAQTRIVYLEDLALGWRDRLAGLVKAYLARSVYRRTAQRGPDDAAVVLFTSGSEGTPKGVVLSHANLLANCAQVAAVVDFNPTDVAFNALPMFHSFGLTGGFLLPVLSGVRTFLYPSPLHYRIVPELVYDTDATIMFGTDTFLAGYARVANAYDFYSVRYVFAGGEKVRDETRRAWMEKFGLRLLEGYGATETAPVIATNTAMMYRAGAVGRLLPGIAHRLEPVEGIERGGRLHVTGPNVMLGYLKAEKPGMLEPPEDGWYDTGDIVDIDAEGFVTILGRAKRFAKVGGEMVPLGAVEELVGRLWPERGHAVVSVPEVRKGEALVLVTEEADASRAALLDAARRDGVPELFVPRSVVHVDKLPRLGTGKPDYVTAKKLAEERLQAD